MTETQSFEVTALNDYKADLMSELSLVAGEHYSILQTSESGWWYAANRNGDTGWVPSNFVERSSEKQAETTEDEPTAAGAEESVTPEESIKSAESEPAAAATPTAPRDVTNQSVKELMDFVKENYGPDGDTFNMTRSLRMIAYKISQEDGAKRDLAESGGFETIVNITSETTDDIAVQMACLQAVALVAIDKQCNRFIEMGDSNPLKAICDSLEIIDHYANHNILAFNAICNVATHEVFRERARGTNLVNIIIQRVLKSENPSEFYMSAALALRNLLVDRGLRENVKSDIVDLVSDILQSDLSAENEKLAGSEARTKTAACGILVNIAQDEHLAKEIIDGGGFERLQDLIANAGLDAGIKKTAVEVMHNLCITASKLDIDTVAVVTFLSSVLEMDSLDIRKIAMKALSAYSAHCTDRTLLLRTLVETGALVQCLKVGLQMDEEEDKKIALNIICFLGQGKENAALLCDTSEIIDAMVSVSPTMTDPGVIRNMCVLFYHMSESKEGQAMLMDGEILNMCQYVKATDAMQALLGVIYRCAQNSRNNELFMEQQHVVRALLSDVPKDTDKLQQLCQAIESLLKQIEINSATKIKARQKAGGLTSQLSQRGSVKTSSAPKASKTKTASKPKSSAAKTSTAAKPKKTGPTPIAVKTKSKTTAKAAEPKPKAEPQVQPAAEDEAPAAEEEEGDYISYEILKARTFDRSKVDIKKLESYLSPTEFERVFKMTKEKFDTLKGWKKVQLKKRVKIF